MVLRFAFVRVHFTIVFTVVAIVAVVVADVFVAHVVVVVLICHFAGRLTLVSQSVLRELRLRLAPPSAFAFKFHTLYKTPQKTTPYPMHSKWVCPPFHLPLFPRPPALLPACIWLSVCVVAHANC